ncbi:MAG: phage portal protein [Novosphingobium sp.]
MASRPRSKQAALKSKAPKAEQKSLSEPEEWMNALFAGGVTISKVRVSPRNAMRCTPVRAAVQAIAEPIGSLPLHVFRRDGDARARDRKHPVAKLMKQPNEHQGGADFREQLQRDCLLFGNGYAFINRVEGRPVELLRLNPASVDVTADDSTGEPVYSLRDGSVRPIARQDILHIKAPSADGLKGESPVQQCREAIALAMLLEKHAARLFSSAARPGGVIEFPEKMDAASFQLFRDAWRETFDNSDGAGKTAILWSGGKFNALTFSSVDAQFLETWKHVITEIARVFRVPPHLIFELGRATWGNAGEMGATFARFTLARWVKAWEGEIWLKLFTDEERDDFYAEFLIDDLLRADPATRASYYSTMRAAGVMSINECRAKENLPPIGPEGDRHDNPHITTSSAPAAPSTKPEPEEEDA